jgi:hypothetical protein
VPSIAFSLNVVDALKLEFVLALDAIHAGLKRVMD